MAQCTSSFVSASTERDAFVTDELQLLCVTVKAAGTTLASRAASKKAIAK